MLHSLRHALIFFLRLLASHVLCQGWEIGSEYLYDYSGLLVTGFQEAGYQSAAVQIIGKLTVQSIDDETLMLKLSEIRFTRDGNYRGKSSDPILFPVRLSNGVEEAIGDSLHLLSPFAVIHNKGSITNLVVESEEPTWSVNMKKAVVSNLQLDVAGVRSGLDGGVFGERSVPSLNTWEDGVTGDCFTTLRITRLPFYHVIQNQALDAHKTIGELCRSAKVYEILKLKDFDQCANDPVKVSSHPRSSTSSFSSHRKFLSDGTLKRFTAYKYLVCGESQEKATIVRMEGVGEMSFLGPVALKIEQSINLIIQKRGKIRDLLPSMSQPRVIDELTYSFDDDVSVPNTKEMDAVLGALQEVAQILTESTVSEEDISEKLSIISRIIFHLDERQLREIWEKGFQQENANVRDLFVDCVAVSGSHTAAVFVVDLVEQRKLEGFQAVWTLMSSGHSLQYPTIPILRRFVGVILSEAARNAKMLKHTALMVTADLLYTTCVLSSVNCNADSQIITEEFLPLLVRELETAQSAIDRVAAIIALGALGVDDVLLLLVPYLRGDNVAIRIAAISSLKHLMDSSSDKVIPLLSSLADNVAEPPEIRMAAIAVLLFHQKTPQSIWNKVASRTWFDSNHQVKAFTCDVIRSLADHSSIYVGEDESTSIKARSVIGLVRPCSDRLGYEHYASIKDNTAGLSSLLAFWRLGDSSLPVYLEHQLFRNLGSFRFDLAKVSIWNYNMENVWSQLTGYALPRTNEPESNVFWDQLFSTFRASDESTVGLVHLRLLGSTMQTLLNLEDIDREDMIRQFFTKHLNIRFVKFQQLIDSRTHVPTELGLPARFSFSLTALASAFGHINQTPEINVTASLSMKWTSESRIQYPFSGHHVAAGEEHHADIRVPISLILNGSLVWIPPGRVYDIAYYSVKPYTLTSQTTDYSSENLRLYNVHPAGPPFVSVAQLTPNLRLETTSEVRQDVPPFAWLSSLMKDFSSPSGHFRLDSFQQRMYRLRYLGEESSVSSVALSASFDTKAIQQEATIEYIIGANGTVEWEEGRTNETISTVEMTDDGIHVFQGEIMAYYRNGSTSKWALEVAAQDLSKEDEWNISASGSVIESFRSLSNFLKEEYSQYLRYNERIFVPQEENSNASQSYLPRILFNVPEADEPWIRYASLLMTNSFGYTKSIQPKTNKCYVHSDRIQTYDEVDYNYTINECYHLLTTDCRQKKANYAVLASRSRSHGMVVRVVLETNRVDFSATGNISINGVEVNFTAGRMQINVRENVMATVTQDNENTLHLWLPNEKLNLIIQENTITLSASEQLLGHACGLCGDGDSEVTGEFKTSNRCALSSGALMAASFLVNMGLEDCPALPDEILQALLIESYPCYSVDEQVASILPLPLEF
ncbi:uncharacterized protein LOC130685509 [Daphnia carinata]|uniref:uncharacterized protein LOC130685509 n=1 Tax=Daphnia carinata TaxID=120202 RepID=UPI00257EAF35|nr:uncharacterized protein LOC130685509 [Daphnia carinata]